MIKEITVEIGGSERKLVFGKMKFLKYAGEVMSDDPLTLLTSINKPQMQFDVVKTYVYAGLKCAGDAATIEEVTEWVEEMDFEIGAKILVAAREAQDVPGEGKAQTDQENKESQ